jgi:hypothetical protein
LQPNRLDSLFVVVSCSDPVRETLIARFARFALSAFSPFLGLLSLSLFSRLLYLFPEALAFGG